MLLTYISRAQKKCTSFGLHVESQLNSYSHFSTKTKKKFPFFDAKFYKTKENHLNARFLLQFFFFKIISIEWMNAKKETI